MEADPVRLALLISALMRLLQTEWMWGLSVPTLDNVNGGQVR